MRIAVAVGTRPEAIKLAPVIAALRAHPGWETVLVATGQHRHLLDQALEPFGLRPDVDLDLMLPDQSLPELNARVLGAMGGALEKLDPKLLVVQGDTTTVFGSALAAFYADVAVAHVEAGLRTDNLRRPYPEEANRRLTSVLTTLHFAPTDGARTRLLEEGVPRDRIAVTGNTVVDTVHWFRERLGGQSGSSSESSRLILLTSHRRENWGADLRAICSAIRRIVDRFDDVRVVYPVHLNPNVQGPVRDMLGGHPRIELLPPLDYPSFMALLAQATLALTDSGGIQEEAPSMGTPVLVLRDVTERPEACEAGVARVVGTDADVIYAETARLLTDAHAYRAMVATRNPFGDGQASSRICLGIERWAAGERPLLPADQEFDAARRDAPADPDTRTA